MQTAFLLTRLLDIVCLSSLIDYYKKHGSEPIIYIINSNVINQSFDKNMLARCAELGYDIKTGDIFLEAPKANAKVIYIANPYLEPCLYDKIAKYFNIIYVPYGYSISGENYSAQLQYKMHIHKIAWRIYTISNFHKGLYQKYNRYRQHQHFVNIKTTPKFDYVRENCKKHTENKYVFLWNIHYSLFPLLEATENRTFSAFFTYYQTLYDVLKNNPDIIIVARTHPGLLQRYKDSFLNAIQIFTPCPNFQIEYGNCTDYSGAFSTADAFISDLSSMYFDFFITGKPIVTLFYDHSCALNSLAQDLFRRTSYMVHSPQDCCETLLRLANGDDPLKPQRERMLGTGNLFDLSRPACELIAEDVAQALSAGVSR